MLLNLILLKWKVTLYVSQSLAKVAVHSRKMVEVVKKEAGDTARGSHSRHGKVDEVVTTVDEIKGNHNTMRTLCCTVGIC